ncbi:hypothetical protein TNCV_1688711 [Trichonephila clavipes]|nr:hypothetical protein TNCV_1688711 [Trichonephila clavipes]
MCFRLALNTSTPSVQILIGEMGNLYFRLWDLIQLLHIKNVRKYFHVFSCKHVFPSHRPYPKAIHNIRLVDIKGFFSILQVENAVMRDLFLKALTHGYVHQTGMRKITDKFKKGPTLTVVDTRDAKSVFIPEWIRRFKLDVKKVRREKVKYPFFESPFNILKDNEGQRKQHSRSFMARREPHVLTLEES